MIGSRFCLGSSIDLGSVEVTGRHLPKLSFLNTSVKSIQYPIKLLRVQIVYKIVGVHINIVFPAKLRKCKRSTKIFNVFKQTHDASGHDLGDLDLVQ